MSKKDEPPAPSETDEKVAAAVTEAAKAEAEKDEAEAAVDEANAAANSVAASNAAVALAKEEAALATQRAAEAINATQGDIAWLKQQAEAQGLSMTELAKRLETSETERTKLETRLEEAHSLIRQKSTPKEPEKNPVTPEKVSEEEDGQEKKVRDEKPKKNMRFM